MSMNKQGCTLWFTGWSGSGKTTLAQALEMELRRRGYRHIQHLDGDLVREDLCHDLGFTKEGRDENIRRVTFVAELLSKNGVVTLVSFISPYRAARDHARERCYNFIEIYVHCNKKTLITRDVKGLYKKAIKGDIPSFTGINDPYEEPLNPDIVVDTARQPVEESLQIILTYLEEKKIL